MFENHFIPQTIRGETYIARQKVGEGRTGAVYRGYALEDADRQHPVAIRFPTVCSSSKQRSDLIKKQAILHQQLASQYIPKYIDHSEHTVCPYLVLEFIPETFTDHITKNTLTQQLFIQYLQQIPIILNFLQQKEQIHGDLKCGNIGIKENTLKILDLEEIRSPGNYKTPSDAPVYYPFEYRIYGNLTLQSDTYTAGRNLEYLLTAQYADLPEETFETIELLHNLTLPNTFKQAYTAMTNRDPLSRPTPQQLITLFQPLIDDILQQNIFHPLELADEKLPDWF